MAKESVYEVGLKEKRRRIVLKNGFGTEVVFVIALTPLPKTPGWACKNLKKYSLLLGFRTIDSSMLQKFLRKSCLV